MSGNWFILIKWTQSKHRSGNDLASIKKNVFIHLNGGLNNVKFTLLSTNVLLWSRISLNTVSYINCHRDSKCNYSFGIFVALLQLESLMTHTRWWSQTITPMSLTGLTMGNYRDGEGFGDRLRWNRKNINRGEWLIGRYSVIVGSDWHLENQWLIGRRKYNW